MTPEISGLKSTIKQKLLDLGLTFTNEVVSDIFARVISHPTFKPLDYHIANYLYILGLQKSPHRTRTYMPELRKIQAAKTETKITEGTTP